MIRATSNFRYSPFTPGMRESSSTESGIFLLRVERVGPRSQATCQGFARTDARHGSRPRALRFAQRLCRRCSSRVAAIEIRRELARVGVFHRPQRRDHPARTGAKERALQAGKSIGETRWPDGGLAGAEIDEIRLATPFLDLSRSEVGGIARAIDGGQEKHRREGLTQIGQSMSGDVNGVDPL